jgi:hypothetical protein
VVRDDAVTDRESEAVAFGLGGEVRLEDALLDRLVDADALVRHAEARHGVLVERLDADHAALRASLADRFGGVREQVQRDLTDLLRIREQRERALGAD